MKFQKDNILSFGVVALMTPHLFCCVLPVVLATLSLIAPVEDAVHIVPHSWEPWLLAASGMMLAMSWFFVVRKCGCERECCRGRRHRIQKIVLWTATAIFAIGLIIRVL